MKLPCVRIFHLSSVPATSRTRSNQAAATIALGAFVQVASCNVHPFARAKVPDHENEVSADGAPCGTHIVDAETHDGK